MARKKTQVAPEEDKAVAKYEPTDLEREALAKMREKKATELPPPRIKRAENALALDHPDINVGWYMLVSSLGTTSDLFAAGILQQLIDAVSTGKEVDQNATNFALAVIAGIKPNDVLETMLAAQMAVVHTATMTQARRLANAETMPQKDSAERALNKLSRTFTTQLEAMKRYRTGGEQKVTVHHVTVNEGGQAIVGTVEQAKDRGEG